MTSGHSPGGASYGLLDAMKKILGIVGSPRKDGNTDLLVSGILEGARDHGTRGGSRPETGDGEVPRTGPEVGDSTVNR